MNQTLHHDKMSALIIFIKYIIALFVDVIPFNSIKVSSSFTLSIRLLF
jgi:hypothetical protein